MRLAIASPNSLSFSCLKKLPVKENGRLAPAWAALAKQPWGSIRSDGLPARLGSHLEAGCLRQCASFPSSSGYITMSIFCVEWLCTQERWNPEVAIIFCAAARYRRAAVGSSHDDAHRGNFTLHTGAVRPYTGFVGSLLFISPRTGHGNSKVFERLPAFSLISWACAFQHFMRGMMHPYFQWACRGRGEKIMRCLGAGDAGSINQTRLDLSRQRRGIYVASSASWLFWDIMAHPLLGEEDSTSPPRWL
jgi:hypothetical protein